MHMVANEIFKDSASKMRIMYHWSKCKIEKETETVALEQIFFQFEQQKNELNTGQFHLWTELARYSIQRAKPQLAMKLIQQEEHQGRKVLVSLLILEMKKERAWAEKVL